MSNNDTLRAEALVLKQRVDCKESLATPPLSVPITISLSLLLSVISGCDDDSPDNPLRRDAPPLLDLSLSVACSDGVDNDGDGLIDAPEDPGCESPQDIDEREPPLNPCDQLDNDNDGLIDFSDPGCLERKDAKKRVKQPILNAQMASMTMAMAIVTFRR